MFDKYTAVTEEHKIWRDIVIANRRPRKIFTQANTVVSGKECKLITYNANLEGFIQSWIERFPQPNEIYQHLLNLTEKDADHFK